MRFLVSLVLLLTACARAPTKLSNPRTDLAPLQRCDDASECVRVDNGCCNCANGGDTISINRKFEKEFRTSFDCEGVVCTERAGDCLFREPACVNHLCVLGPQKQRFPRK